MRMIFVNLPVKDVKASRAFFAALGLGFNEQFCSDDTACLVIEENIFAMLLEHRRFKDFIKTEISDTAKAKEVLLALSCDSRAEVEDLKARAIAAGGSPWMPVQDHGFMYGDSFQDPDGHVWELIWMDPAVASGEKEVQHGV